MPETERMTDQRFRNLEAGIEQRSRLNGMHFVDFATFVEVFNELKAMREERK
jgi:hypothetical protein